MSPPDRLHKIVRPLLRLLSSAPPEVQAVVLDDCALVADQRPDLLADHLPSFFVRFSEPLASKRARLRILVALASERNVRTVLAELLVSAR